MLYYNVGNRTVPSHARKGKTIYRYYVSTPLVRGSKKPVGAISRVGALKIDGAVVSALEQAKLSPLDVDAAELVGPIKKIALHRDELEIKLADAKGCASLPRVPINLTSGKSATRLTQNDGVNPLRKLAGKTSTDQGTKSWYQ